MRRVETNTNKNLASEMYMRRVFFATAPGAPNEKESATTGEAVPPLAYAALAIT